MITLALATLFAITPSLYAQGPGPGPGGPGGRGFGGEPMFALRDLDLSETQRQQVRDVMQRYQAQTRDAGQRLQQAFEAQRKAVETVPVNEGLIRSTTQDLATAQTEMAIQQARIHSEILALLTPEQQEKAKKAQADREARTKQRRSQFQERLRDRQRN
jgi:Spy/CpxP family protein refolding chaperone